MKQKKSSLKTDQQSERHKLKKSKEKSQHRSQGKQAPSKLAVDSGTRSGGDAFAYGLSNALAEAESMRGSAKEGFLGVSTKMLDPSAYVERGKLNVKKD